ncbi:MAG: hypothetical protein K2H90_08485 [Oscillospiraceae bacterium]|nr:hypothetical protein [Oscillospiraceae bacterium]
MFCPKCGKELTEGEPCSCGYSKDDEQAVSSLPDGKVIVDGAKKAAEAVKNNPYVSEVLSVITGLASDPEKQVKNNSERTDILWVIMTVFEALIISLGLAMYLNKLMYMVLEAASLGFYSVEMPKGLFFRLFGAAFLWSAICIFVLVLIYILFMKICKKQVSFSAAANTMTTAVMPSAIITFAAGLLSLIYAPIGIFMILAALISLVALCFGLVRNIGGTKIPVFWLFVIFAAVTSAIYALAGNICVKMFAESMADALTRSLF